MFVAEPAHNRNRASLSRWYRFFKIDHEQPRGVRFIYAAVLTLIAIAVRLWLQPSLGPRLSYDFPIVFILVIAWSTGAPMALCSLATTLIATKLLITPAAVVGATNQAWELVHFLVPALVGIGLVESLRRSRRRIAEDQAGLAREVHVHRQAEAELEAAREALRQYANDLEQVVGERTDELRAALHFQKEFTYVIVHDLRAPVRAVLGFTQIISERSGSSFSPEDADLLERIRKAGLRMEHLVNGLIELGRVANASAACREVNLDRAVAMTLAHMKPALPTANPIIVESPLGSAWTNEHMLQCVLRELIDNALRFGKPGVSPQIRIHTETAGEVITVSVTDNGVGIAEVYHRRIFGCFQTLNRQDPEHTGVGLAIVAEAAARLHAVVRVKSKPNEGACLQIDLPRRAPHKTPICVIEPMPAAGTVARPTVVQCRNCDEFKIAS
jgi:signal transduction histidine kinase